MQNTLHLTDSLDECKICKWTPNANHWVGKCIYKKGILKLRILIFIEKLHAKQVTLRECSEPDMGNHISKCILGGVFLAAQTIYNQAFYITSQTRVTLMRQLA
jgi:hypothetical protein